MMIFDGVAVKPTLNPAIQGVLTVVSLVANSLLEADRVREERQTGEDENPATGGLGEVMAQAGLKLPPIDEMLAQLMGGGEEAKKAASLIVNNPDPAVLLQRFAEHFGGQAAKAGPTVTPRANARPAGPTTATAPGGGPLTFRPEFTRQGRAAARAAARTSGGPGPADTRSVDVPVDAVGRSAGSPAAPVPTPAVEVPGQPSIDGMAVQQAGEMQRRVKAREVELDVRLKQVEADLTALRRSLGELVAEQIAEPVHAAAEDVIANVGTVPRVADPETALDCKAPHEVPVEPDVPVCSDTNSPPPAASDENMPRVGHLIAEHVDDMEAQHRRQLARVAAAEREIAAMHALVQQQREAMARSRG